MSRCPVAFIDPLESIWGFHVHQELPEPLLPKALVVQQRCREYLLSRGVAVDHDDVMEAGYGPHLQCMWELRVESLPSRRAVLKELGEVVAFVAVNRAGLPAYVHPTRQDSGLPTIEELRQEGLLNQPQAVWFGARVPQFQEFFFNPPLTPHGDVADTRTQRVMPLEKREGLLRQGVEQWTAEGYPAPAVAPHDKLIRGFHVHVDFLEEQTALAYDVFDHLVTYLLEHGVRPSSTRLYGAGENGPHVQKGWEVKFEYRDAATTHDALGVTLGWLMCNRHGLNVFAHGVTWEEGDIAEELKAHREYAFFIGALPPLDLTFFVKRLPRRE